MVKKHGGNQHEYGCICLSKKKKNIVNSNVIGCAAYHGKTAILKHLLDKMPGVAKEFEVIE